MKWKWKSKGKSKRKLLQEKVAIGDPVERVKQRRRRMDGWKIGLLAVRPLGVQVGRTGAKQQRSFGSGL